MQRWSWILLIVLVVASAMVACGNDDDDDSGADDDLIDDDIADDDLIDDDTADDDVTDDDIVDDDTTDDDTIDDDVVDDDTIDDDTIDDDTIDDDTIDDDTIDDDIVDDDTFTDDDTFPVDECSTLEDPADPGAFDTIAWEYGHDGDPDARTTNVQQYFFFPDFYVRFVRKIKMSAVPLHAVGYYPDGDGPFPLVLIVHGNHNPEELSYPGYDYLTSHLATHGFIAVSVEEDFLNGGVSGEMDARGIVLLRHLQLFREWNQDPAHPLYGKINMRQIGLAGHSRGGEGITAAWLFNTTKHNPADPLHKFHFRIRSLFAIAPVDGQLFMFPFNEVVLRNVDYFIMHGSHDGDVSDFQGHGAYDRALPVDEPGEAEKALLFAQGANHGQWNQVWAPGGDPYPPSYSNVPLMSADDQQMIGLLFMTGWFRWTLQGRACYRLMTAGEREFPSFPAITLNRQYQNEERLFLAHYQEDSDQATASYPGATISGPNLALWYEDDMPPGETMGVFNAWDTTGASYRIDLPASDDLDDMTHLSLNVGQVYESSDVYNIFGDPQDFAVQLVIDGVTSDPLIASDYRTLVSPCRVIYGGSYDRSKTVLDTLRIPLEDFDGGNPVLPSQVEAIILTYEQKPSGKLGIDEISFTVW